MNESVCETTMEFTAPLDADMFILSFYWDIRSLLREPISASSAVNLFWLLDSRLLLREETLVGKSDVNVIVLEPWSASFTGSAKILDCRRGRSAFLPAAFDTLDEWIGSSAEFAEFCSLFLSGR